MERGGDSHKSNDAVMALRLIRKDHARLEFYRIQAYWSRRSKEKGIATEADLERHLSR
ncbi:MAG: hypothetical protein OHK006_08160 [Thermodesulfovibrionales bacterium]